MATVTDTRYCSHLQALANPREALDRAMGDYRECLEIFLRNVEADTAEIDLTEHLDPIARRALERKTENVLRLQGDYNVQLHTSLREGTLLAVDLDGHPLSSWRFRKVPGAKVVCSQCHSELPRVRYDGFN